MRDLVYWLSSSSQMQNSTMNAITSFFYTVHFTVCNLTARKPFASVVGGVFSSVVLWLKMHVHARVAIMRTSPCTHAKTDIIASAEYLVIAQKE